MFWNNKDSIKKVVLETFLTLQIILKLIMDVSNREIQTQDVVNRSGFTSTSRQS